MGGGKGPVIPNFGQGDSCVTGDHTFCWGWVRDHWDDTLGPALWQHVELTVIAVVIGFAIAFPLALLAHRFRALEQPFGSSLSSNVSRRSGRRAAPRLASKRQCDAAGGF